MRVGYTVSVIGHAAAIGFGFIAFPEAQPFKVENIEALPIDLVSVSDVTDLLKGDKNSRLLPAEKPQPKAEAKAEAPAPEQAERPAEKPVEAARPPTPKPPPPPPVTEPEPEPAPEPEQVAALPPPEEAAPSSEPEPKPAASAEPAAPPAPASSRVPKARPRPPRIVAEAKPAAEPPDPLRKLAEQPAEKPQKFNPDDIAALLDKRTPAGGGDPNPSPEPQTLGSIDGKANAAMTQSELAALQARLYQCWNPPVGVREAGSLVVTVRISLLVDGSLSVPPQILSVGSVSDPLSQIAAESAIRAVVQCAPFGDVLRPEKYALWRDIDFVFDPRQMFGG